MYNLLYVKSYYSLLSSLLSIDDIIDYNLTMKKNHAIICDNNMYGTMEFVKKCQSNNLKPVVGLEITLGEFKILIYARNYHGYLNMIKICTYQNDNTLNIDKLIEHKEDLYFLIPYESNEFYKKYRNVIKYLYLGFSNKKEEEEALLITKDIVYLKLSLYKDKKDSDYLKYLYLINDLKTVNDNINYDIDNKELNTSDIINTYDNIGLINTIKIVDDCNLEFPKSVLLLPLYDCPNNMSSFDYLKALSIAGLTKRLKGNITNTYKDRLIYELDVINNLGFANYFLVVYDFICYAKKKGILVGPGRGSAAGSLVAYSLGITEIDPLKYNLLFERFLNKERMTMPDIDTDIPDIYRDDIINYVTNKYGNKKVAGIVTFSTLACKQVLRDVGRVLNIPLYKIDKLTNFIPAMSHKKLDEFYKENVKFREYLLSDESLKKVYLIASKLEGFPRQIGTHAAGIVMCKKNLDEVIPLTKSDNMYLTGYSMNYLEELGLLKMDFLGIRNLTIIMNVIDMIYKNRNIRIDFNNIVLDDSCVYNLFAKGDTTGIFQFESSGMRNFLKKLKPTNFNDLIAAIALFRPGPAENIDLYIRRKEGKEKVIYQDKCLEPILKDTYGIMIYQEQIMLVANYYAGYTLGEADILRRAISKKKVDILKNEETKFIEKATRLGRNINTSRTLFASILKFAGYGFNKSHAVAYSIIAYKMAYLKVHYKLEFYANLLSNVISVNSKLKEYLNEIRACNINVLKPDINISTNKFVIENANIIFPFGTIKGIGINVSSNILNARNNRKFTNIYDAFKRLVNSKVTKKQIETLIIADAFRSFGYNKKTLITNLDSLYNYGELTIDLDESLVLKPEIEVTKEFSDSVLLEQEIDCFGFYISNHPVTSYRSKYQSTIKLIDLSKYFNKTVTTLVMVEKIKAIKTKKNEDMAFVTASDETGTIDFIFFPRIYKTNLNISKGDICKLEGTVEKRFDELQLIVKTVEYIRRNDEEE